MSRMTNMPNRRLWWVLLLAPMVGVPTIVLIGIAIGKPIGIIALTSACLLGSPGLICLLLTRVEGWLKASTSELTSIMVMSSAAGASYLIIVLEVIGLVALCGLEFKGGICHFLSTWHWGHPVFAGAFALTLFFLEQRKSRSAALFHGSREHSGDQVSGRYDAVGHEQPRRSS